MQTSYVYVLVVNITYVLTSILCLVKVFHLTQCLQLHCAVFVY